MARAKSQDKIRTMMIRMKIRKITSRKLWEETSATRMKSLQGLDVMMNKSRMARLIATAMERMIAMTSKSQTPEKARARSACTLGIKKAWSQMAAVTHRRISRLRQEASQA